MTTSDNLRRRYSSGSEPAALASSEVGIFGRYLDPSLGATGICLRPHRLRWACTKRVRLLLNAIKADDEPCAVRGPLRIPTRIITIESAESLPDLSSTFPRAVLLQVSRRRELLLFASDPYPAQLPFNLLSPPPPLLDAAELLP